MLNRALQLMDMNIRFLIHDLHRHIELLNSEQLNAHYSNKSFTVYREQGMLKADEKN